MNILQKEHTPTKKISCLHHILENNALEFPLKACLSDGEFTYTYSALNKKVNQLANFLSSQGIEQNQRIGVLINHSPNLIWIIFAILKIGCVYIPLDSSWPQERIEFIIKDSNIRLLISDEAFKESLTFFKHTFFASELHKICLEYAEDNPKHTVLASNLAYIIYTSGTTGRPKGVKIAHQNVIALLLSTSQVFQFSLNDNWLLFHSIAFDFSVWEIFGAFFNKGKLYIFPIETIRAPNKLLDILKKYEITILNQTPLAFLFFKSGVKKVDILSTHLKYIIFGGDKFYTKYISDFLLDRHCKITFINMYGITETTVHATYYQFSLKDADAPLKNIIGFPLPNLQVFINGKPIQEIKEASEGELEISGPSLSEGYLNLDELTATKFVQIGPFRIFKTGDLVKFNEMGRLEFIGRIDNQVKLNGYRIEPGEIEFCLLEHPQVLAVHVVTEQFDEMNKWLAAYYVSTNGLEIDEDQLTEFLAKKIPLYMLPQRYCLISEDDINHNGKLTTKPPIDNSINA